MSRAPDGYITNSIKQTLLALRFRPARAWLVRMEALLYAHAAREGREKRAKDGCKEVCSAVCGLTACVGGPQSRSTEVKFAKIEHKRARSPFPSI